ncbi:MAG: hypothetical protein GXY13_16035 [Acidimicrobiales bacterium]|nr:hypothetical protein [Acidimicrobiales bacterium]
MTASSPTTEPEASSPEGPAEERPRSRALVILGVSVFVVMIGFWGWAFGESIARRNQPATERNADYLDDRDWVEAAEATCAATMEGIDGRTVLAARQTATERADTIDLSTDELEVMLASLADPGPDSADDLEVVSEWLADWDQLVSDRRTYADALRDDADARFYTIEKFNDPLDRVVATFADVNEMPSCGPAGDVG